MGSAPGLKGSLPPCTTRCLDSPYLNPPPIVSYPAGAVFIQSIATIHMKFEHSWVTPDIANHEHLTHEVRGRETVI